MISHDHQTGQTCFTCSIRPPFSAINKHLSGSKTELSLSKTASSAREISSTSKHPPSCIAFTKMPSLHSNNAHASLD